MNLDRLYQLLPPIYRERDLDQGAPLQMLLRIITEQANVVEQDIAQLYDNWFIETCQEWVVPYIGDLVGYRPVHQPGEQLQAGAQSLQQILFPRREVANTIRYRRRKGTLALLQEISAAITGWPVRVVETDRLRSILQAVNHVRTNRGRTVDLRDQRSLDALGTPFSSVGLGADLHSHDAQQAISDGVASVTVFAWRLRVYPVARTPAYCMEEVGDHCFLFSITGADTPLYNQPQTDPSQSTQSQSNQPRSDQPLSGELDLPVPIKRRMLETESKAQPARRMASELFYGEGRSIAIWAGDWARCDPKLPVPAEKIIPADLSDWAYRPEQGHIALDPELGRIAFPPTQLPEQVSVSHSYAFAADIGGGAYPRTPIAPPGSSKVYYVGKAEHLRSIHAAYEAWRHDTEQILAGSTEAQPPHGIIEIIDSSVYEERLHLEVGDNQTLELRAAPNTRPSIFLADWHSSQPDALTVSGGPLSEFTINGLLVSGRGIEINGDLRTVRIRHCTLVPGWFLHADRRPRRAGEPSVTLSRTSAALEIDHSILGPIRVNQEDAGMPPLRIDLRDSILDATHASHAALSSTEDSIASALLSVRRSTVHGAVRTHAIDFAEHSIFAGLVHVARRQVGCMRFCYVPPESRTPQRFHCQPDGVDAAVREATEHHRMPHEDREALFRAERRRVQPEFLSDRYGTPDYCRLADNNAPEILAGAEDEAEIGVFHDLFQPQRQANLRARMDESMPAGMNGIIIYAT